MIFSYLFGIMQISFMESQVILKNGLRQLRSLKQLIITGKRLKKVEIISDEFHISMEKSAEDELIVMEDREELLKLINQLEPLDQKVFIMKYLLGMKTEEIGDKLGLTRAKNR